MYLKYGKIFRHAKTRCDKIYATTYIKCGERAKGIIEWCDAVIRDKCSKDVNRVIIEIRM